MFGATAAVRLPDVPAQADEQPRRSRCAVSDPVGDYRARHTWPRFPHGAGLRPSSGGAAGHAPDNFAEWITPGAPASFAGYIFVASKAATSCQPGSVRLAEGWVRKLCDGVSGYSDVGATATARSAPVVLQSRRRPAVMPDLKGWWRRKCLRQQVRPDVDEDRLHNGVGFI